ncbi:single-stranded DNA-binding protein [Neolewinella agarilytica]|uniref:Single-stranded DNA-binding protein n=1 Tax=Neolewinella agarilytica TaxID=478744 RepID=A0A1H9K0I9_9BACT|nr:single-stranded DNA-binding protein [Neolewinella agarilytica]SEQ92518.1 single-strand binding protein [Neolewinella agarilytica]
MQVRNSITLIGNLGSNPKTATLPSGRLATEFSLATNDYYKDKDGNRQTRTEWHKIKAYGKLAEVFDKHLVQGSQVCIAGALRYSKWIDKHDQVRVTAEIVADSFTFLSGGRQAAAEQELEEEVIQPSTNKPAKKRSRKKAVVATEDVIPF